VPTPNHGQSSRSKRSRRRLPTDSNVSGSLRTDTDKRFAAYGEFNNFFDAIERSIETGGEYGWKTTDELKVIHLALFLFDGSVEISLSRTMVQFDAAIDRMRRERDPEKRRQQFDALHERLRVTKGEMDMMIVPFLQIRHQIFPSPAYYWDRTSSWINVWLEDHDVIRSYVDRVFHRK
jgi:hypothetical protein